MNKMAPFTREQETELFAKARAGDGTAYDTLVKANIGLVVIKAKEVHRRCAESGIDFSDLMQVGTIGVMKAIDKFDPSSGNKFSTYAVQWIRQAIGRYVNKNSRAVFVPEHILNAVNKIKTANRKFVADNGRDPTDAELSRMTEMSRSKIADILSDVQPITSIHSPIGDDSDGTEFGDMLSDVNAPDPGANVFRDDFDSIMTGVTDGLSGNERLVMMLRYGAVASKMSMSTFAELVHVGPEQIKSHMKENHR